jgi:ferredoxin
MIFGFSKKEETDDGEPKKLRVSKSRCPQNHPCPSIRVCPTGALSQKGYAAPVVDDDKCISCGKCVRFCPMRAISLEKVAKPA